MDAKTLWDTLSFDDVSSALLELNTFHKRIKTCNSKDAQAPYIRALQLLEAALRLDLALLRQSPGSLYSCLALRWHGHPDTPKIHDILQKKLDEWLSQRPPKQPCLRPIRTPKLALDGSLYAELRTPFWASPIRIDGNQVLFSSSRWDPTLEESITTHYQWDIEQGTFALVDYQPTPQAVRVTTNSWNGGEVEFLQTPKPRVKLEIEEDTSATDTAVSKDGTLCLLMGWGGEYDFCFVRIYECATGRLIRQFLNNDSSSSSSGCFSEDGSKVLVVQGTGASLFDIQSGKRLAFSPAILGPAILDAQTERIVCAREGGLAAYSIDKLQDAVPPEDVGGVNPTFSPSGHRLIDGEGLYEPQSGKRIARLKLAYGSYLEGGPVRNWFWMGDKRIVSLYHGAEAWDAETGKRIVNDGSAWYVHRYLACHRQDGLYYAVANFPPLRTSDRSRRHESGARVEIVETDTGAHTPLAGPDEEVTCLRFSPDGTQLVTGTENGAVECWDPTTGQKIRTYPGHSCKVTGLAFSIDGKLLASAGDNETLRVWNVADGTLEAERPVGTQGTKSTTYHEDGKKVTSWQWNGTPSEAQSLPEWMPAFAQPSKPAASAISNGGVTQFLDPHTKQPLLTLPINGPWVHHPHLPLWAAPEYQFEWLDGNEKSETSPQCNGKKNVRDKEETS